MIDLTPILSKFQPDPASRQTLQVQKAILVARELQERASALQTASERRQQAELDRMLQTPSDKSTLAQMTDQAFRSNVPHRAVDQFIHILDVQGVPRFFSPFQRTLHTPVELMDFIGTIEKSLGVEAKKNFLPMQNGDVVATYADVEELKRDVGFEPKTPLADGIARWASWYKPYHKL